MVMFGFGWFNQPDKVANLQLTIYCEMETAGPGGLPRRIIKVFDANSLLNLVCCDLFTLARLRKISPALLM